MSFAHFIFFIFALLVHHSYAVDFHDFDSYQLKLTAQEVEWKIKTFLEKSDKIKQFYRLTSECLYVGDLENKQMDYVLRLNENPFIPPKKRQPHANLKNRKIAIDPGHFGGQMAELEER